MKKLQLIILAMIISILAVGCNISKGQEENQDEFYTNADYIYVDYSHELLTFEMLILTGEKIENIQVLDVDGENISMSDFDVTVDDNSNEQIKKFSYKGFHPSIWYFNFQPKTEMEDIFIDEMTILVNDKERKINFSNRLHINSGTGTKLSGKLEPGIIPMEFPGSVINGELKPTYSFTATEDMKIDNIYSNGELLVSIDSIIINGTENKEVEYPIVLKEGDIIELNIGFSSEKLSSNNFVLTDLFIDYSTGSETDIFKSLITISPIYPILDNDLSPLEDYINLIISKK